MAAGISYIDTDFCVACGACVNVCPKEALYVYKGRFAAVKSEFCVGCGICSKKCPAGAISIQKGGHL